MSNIVKKNTLVLFLMLPFFYLIYAIFVEEANDPIKYIFTVTGISAMFLLIITTLLSAIKLTKYRKMLGLSAFFYSFLHFINFIVLDAELDVDFIFKESVDKPFIYLGMLSFFMLFFMALTSTKQGFKKHHKKHKIIYIAILLTIAHFLIGQKAITIEYWWYIVIFVFVIFYKGKIVFQNMFK